MLKEIQFIFHDIQIYKTNSEMKNNTNIDLKSFPFQNLWICHHDIAKNLSNIGF